MSYEEVSHDEGSYPRKHYYELDKMCCKKRLTVLDESINNSILVDDNRAVVREDEYPLFP